MFSGVRERVHWEQMGYSTLSIMLMFINNSFKFMFKANLFFLTDTPNPDEVKQQQE